MSDADPPLPHPRLRSPATWLLVLALIASAAVLRPFALELGAGLVLGYVSERPVRWVLRRIRRESSARWHWVVATGFAIVVLLALLLPALFALWVALRDLAAFLTGGSGTNLGRLPTTAVSWIQRRAAGYGLQFNPADITLRLRGALGAGGNYLGRHLGRALTATPAALFSLFLVLVAWVTFTVQGRPLRDRVIPEIIPWAREREIIRRTTAEVIEGVVLANVGVSVVQALVVAIATVALRIPNAAVWSVASFALSFVPFVGTGVVTLSATAWLFAAGRTGAAVAMLVVAILAGSIDNVLRPMLARGSTELPFLWMLVAFVGGVAAFGLAGVILGPLVLAWSVALWDAAHARTSIPPPDRL